MSKLLYFTSFLHSTQRTTYGVNIQKISHNSYLILHFFNFDFSYKLSKWEIQNDFPFCKIDMFQKK